MKKSHSPLLTALFLSGLGLLSGQTISTVINAADATAVFSPGMVVLIRGANFTSLNSAINAFPAPTSLGGVSAQFVAADGATSALPILAVSPTEIRAQLPYDVAAGPATVTIGTSTTTINLDALAPRLITDFQGAGDLLMFHSNPQRIVSRQDPVRPGETVFIFGHGFGQTNPPVVAGADPGSNPSPAVLAAVNLSINGLQAQITDVSLLELNPGVYKITAMLAYDDSFGTVPVIATVGGVSAQTSTVIPLVANGLYYQILGSTSPSPISLNGISGATSSLAARHDNVNYWGANGFLNWTKSTGLNSIFEPIRGLALTLQNGDTRVFANHGIEDNNGAFYTNPGNLPDSSVPGLLKIYSMSNLYDFIGSGYFRLSSPATFDTIMGYFDGNGDVTLPFDPDSPYIHYRMNLWSNSPAANAPLETGTFVGNVFSSDSTPGTFSWSYTGVDRGFRDNPPVTTDPIFRLVYKLPTPLTLPAGDYWFSHDAIVPAVGSFGFPGSATGNAKTRMLTSTPAKRDATVATGVKVERPIALRMNP